MFYDKDKSIAIKILTGNLHSLISCDQIGKNFYNYEEKLANSFSQQTHIKYTCLQITSKEPQSNRMLK